MIASRSREWEAAVAPSSTGFRPSATALPAEQEGVDAFPLAPASAGLLARQEVPDA